jgi:hypothetical protein
LTSWGNVSQDPNHIKYEKAREAHRSNRINQATNGLDEVRGQEGVGPLNNVDNMLGGVIVKESSSVAKDLLELGESLGVEQVEKRANRVDQVTKETSKSTEDIIAAGAVLAFNKGILELLDSLGGGHSEGHEGQEEEEKDLEVLHCEELRP